MLYKGLEMTDSVIKEKYVFKELGSENGGKRLVYECQIEPTDRAISPVHVHPFSDEKFVVLEGEITIKTCGKENIYKAGDRINIKKGTPHTGYNKSNKNAIVLCTVEPAMTMGEYIYATTRLSNMGKTNKHNLPNLLTVAAMGYKYKDQAYLPQFIVLQRIYFSTVGRMVAWVYDQFHIEY
ncbi:MAG: cupin domain-containing protein [Clostridiales bacterium]|nr:cupin domain-containing protein [Clostridiales bacterium]